MLAIWDDDETYNEWCERHPDGFVLNADRKPTRNYLFLHTARCDHIRTPNPDGHWTLTAMKACATERQELLRWAREIVGGEPRRCQSCAP